MSLFNLNANKDRRISKGDSSVRVMMHWMTDDISESTADEALMLAYKNGQLLAFETLYHRHKAAVYRFILRHGMDKPIAEELLQDIWSSIIKSRSTYRDTAKFTTWLYQIARNRLVDYYRSNKEHVQLLSDDVATIEDTNESSGEARDEAFNAIRQAITSLPFPQRQAFLLHYEAGLSVPDIADITQEHAEAVKSRIRYAVDKLRNKLGGHDE